MLAKLAADSKLPVCTVQSTWDRSGKHAAQLGKIGKQTHDKPPVVACDIALGLGVYCIIIWHSVISLLRCRWAGYSSGQAESRG